MSKAEVRQRLNIFLLKEGTLLAQAVKEDLKAKAHDIKAELGLVGKLYTSRSSAHPPAWHPFLQTATTASLNELIGQSSSALLLLEVEERIFCIAFGYSRSWISDEHLERRFGMLVTLNCVDPNKIKSVDRDEFDTVTRNTRSQTSVSSAIENFGLNIQRDLVRSVTGQPEDESFGMHVTGADNLILTAKLSIEELPAKCAKALELSKLKKYKENYAWIDNFQRVRDTSIIEILDERLVQQLRSGETENIFLSPPSIIDTQEARSYRYPGQRKALEGVSDIRLDEFLEGRDVAKLSADSLRKMKIYEFTLDHDQEVGSFSVYDSVVFEVKQGKTLYALTRGEWFAIDDGYVKSVEKILETISANKKLQLPLAIKGETEGQYNLRAAKASGGNLLCLDAKNVMYGGGKSKIEICDLLTQAGDFIHVKAKTKSATLSHLFSQGLVSAQVMRDLEFRKLAIAQCTKPHSDIFSEPFSTSKIRICFAIISATPLAIGEALPFFSKQSLVNSAKELRNMGYSVSLDKIALA